MANQQSKRDNARTFVLEDKNNPNYIIDYYTLTIISLDFTSLPDKLQKKHYNFNTAALIARLAVNKRYQNSGFGEWLLVDALKKLLNVNKTVPFPIIVVDAKDGAEEFYKKYGFTPFSDVKNRLFITIDTVRKSFGNL